MTTQELINTYPKSVEVVKKWIQNQMIEAFSGDSFKLDVSPIEDEYLIAIIEKGPRALFDVFDANKIYVSIIRNADEFNYEIWVHKHLRYKHSGYKLRLEAENKAIIDAFDFLEERL